MTTRNNDQPRQRWQILFARRHPALRIRQAELLTEFERASRESGLPLATSNALHPRPRLKFAANLPVGIELRGEVLEAYFDDLVPLDKLHAVAELLREGSDGVGRRQ